MISRSTIYAVLSLSLASCAVGPRFKAPAADVPPAFGAAPKQAVAPARVSSEEPGPNWWHEFHDDELDRLEDRARRGNLDLQSGLLRIVEARTQVQAARAQGLPSLNATASYNREQLGFAGILKAQGGTTGTLDPALVSALTSPVSLYQVGFDASWELDLFGKVSRSVEAAKAQSEEAVESRNDMLVSLQAEVAQTYMQLRAAQLLRSVTQGMIADQQEILELTMSKHDHGLADDADVESARAQVSSLRAQLPQYDQNMAASRHALSVLVGETPAALDVELGPAAPLPAVPQLIPIGLPSTLARRRPDIREAEASLRAATAQIGVSMASLYPDVALAGTLGLRNIGTHYLFDWASKFYTAGPTVSLPIFHGGALVANVKMARAEEAAAALAYRKTVLTALQEVEDGLVSLDQDGVRVTALHDTVAADQRSFEIATHSYKVGLTSYVSVLTQALQTNQAKEQLAQASLMEVTDLVKLYKALGGGWQSDPTSASN
jgi:NodT family efflux transporter outer membrane factor (OMF) lipoprotein